MKKTCTQCGKPIGTSHDFVYKSAYCSCQKSPAMNKELEKKVKELERRIRTLEEQRQPLRIVGTDLSGKPLIIRESSHDK